VSFYLPNPEVRPTGAEAAEFVDTVPPEYPAIPDPPTPRRGAANGKGASPSLDAEQIGALAEHGEVRSTEPGTVLYRAGDAECDFFVVVAGTVEMIEDLGGAHRVLEVHGAGRFLGELGHLTGEAMSVSAVVGDAGAVVAVPAFRLRELIVGDTRRTSAPHVVRRSS
jgi:thioredoxin reductase (NADPH)